MNRAPFQILVFPYRIASGNRIFYALFRRKLSGKDVWQGIAGGGEKKETPLEAAKRETFEESGIKSTCEYTRLDSCSMIPVVDVCGFKWGNKILVIPEYCFGVRTDANRLHLSDEHLEYKWLTYNSARKILRWDSNKTALWELNFRINEIMKRKRKI